MQLPFPSSVAFVALTAEQKAVRTPFFTMLLAFPLVFRKHNKAVTGGTREGGKEKKGKSRENKNTVTERIRKRIG